MSLRDLFATITPNPDLIGRVEVMLADVEPEKLDAMESKLRRARAYLDERKIKVRPICRTLPEEESK